MIRPDEWNGPVLLHVFGAMLLVGALITVGALSLASLRAAGDGSAALTRLAFRSVLYAVIPAYVLMRIGAQWSESEEGVESGAWLDVGYIVADGGALLVIVSAVLAGLAARRGSGRAEGLMKAVAAISVVLVVAYLIAAWVMTTKPA